MFDFLQVLSWLCKKGEDILSKHAQHTATNLTSARLHEREFEKFYFTSMVSNVDCPIALNGIKRRAQEESSLPLPKRRFHFFRDPLSRSSRLDAKEIPSRRKVAACNKHEIIKDSFVTGGLLQRPLPSVRPSSFFIYLLTE